MKTSAVTSLVTLVGTLFLVWPSGAAEELSPTGRNVCQNPRAPPSSVCCAGWTQQGTECPIPLCVGERSCQQDEVCVYPGMCRCKPGFYGARCKTRCPPEFWAPDCRELCECHPYGRCDPATGKCTCLPNRWGALCQNTCRCSRHGHCEQEHGNCTCDEGWWTPTCGRACQCHPGTSTCDPLTGRCRCHPGAWGPKCSLRCNCLLSPCQQLTGDCLCLPGWWGPTCERRCLCDLTHGECDPTTGTCLCHPGYRQPVCHETCAKGNYGSGCEQRCGHCAGAKPCSKISGACHSCQPGWNGTRCDQPCPKGYHGSQCLEVCPRCRREEPCDPETGACLNCEPGLTGPRCEQPCPADTYGDGCRFLCAACVHGICDHVTGSCVCHPGFEGQSCNSTCLVGRYGANCSSWCECGEAWCHAATGVCQHSSRAGLIAGLLIPLLVLILALLLCCCCCGGPAHGKDRVAVGDGGPSVRVKHHVYSVLANVGAALPCMSVWSSGLPRVTVSHHDPELTFNHSFIEPPSSGWVTGNSSFESEDGEAGEAVYCVPPREDIPTVAGGEFQELSSKCNMFPDPTAFCGEDMALAFGIPRTSSIAKAKRPSVSFAEGTKFSPKEPRGSGQDPPPPVARKPKSPLAALVLSSLQSPSRADGDGEREGGEVEAERGDIPSEPDASAETAQADSGIPHAAASRTYLTVPAGRRRTMSNTRRSAQAPQGPPEGRSSDAEEGKVSTVYVTVGRGHGQEPLPKGPVQAMLRRLGSLQRQREEAGRPRGRGPPMAKPPRRKLGARASAWEEEGAAGVTMRKTSLRKHTSLSSPGAMAPSTPPTEHTTPKRPLSSILKSVPESPTLRSEAEYESVAMTTPDPSADEESGYQTVCVSADLTAPPEVIANGVVVGGADEGPKYENVIIKRS